MRGGGGTLKKQGRSGVPPDNRNQVQYSLQTCNSTENITQLLTNLAKNSYRDYLFFAQTFDFQLFFSG